MKRPEDIAHLLEAIRKRKLTQEELDELVTHYGLTEVGDQRGFYSQNTVLYQLRQRDLLPADKPKWSDFRKWTMGILASLIVAVLVAIVIPLLKSMKRDEPYAATISMVASCPRMRIVALDDDTAKTLFRPNLACAIKITNLSPERRVIESYDVSFLTEVGWIEARVFGVTGDLPEDFVIQNNINDASEFFIVIAGKHDQTANLYNLVGKDLDSALLWKPLEPKQVVEGWAFVYLDMDPLSRPPTRIRLMLREAMNATTTIEQDITREHLRLNLALSKHLGKVGKEARIEDISMPELLALHMVKSAAGDSAKGHLYQKLLPGLLERLDDKENGWPRSRSLSRDEAP